MQKRCIKLDFYARMVYIMRDVKGIGYFCVQYSHIYIYCAKIEKMYFNKKQSLFGGRND